MVTGPGLSPLASSSVASPDVISAFTSASAQLCGLDSTTATAECPFTPPCATVRPRDNG